MMSIKQVYIIALLLGNIYILIPTSRSTWFDNVENLVPWEIYVNDTLTTNLNVSISSTPADNDDRTIYSQTSYYHGFVMDYAMMN